MFARTISIQLKVNEHKQFSELFHGKIVPSLRKQQGFRDVQLLVVPGAPEALAISFWNSREDADGFFSHIFPQLRENLSRFLERDLEMKNYLVAFSTSYKIASAERVGIEEGTKITSTIPGVGGG